MVRTRLGVKIQNAAKDSEYRYIVSLDVHSKNTYVFAVDLNTGEIISDHNVLGSVWVALKVIDRLGIIKKKTLILYESGNCGFHPAWLFIKAGYACRIIAANSIPSKGSGRRKTDRADATNNFQYFMAGSLRFVRIPSEAEVANREILRYRYEISQLIGKQKQKIFALTKRYGLLFTGTKTTWTVSHLKWLREVETHGGIRFVLDAYLNELERLEREQKESDRRLNAVFNSNQQYKALKELYSMVPGLGQVNTMTLVLEAGDLGRFPHPHAFMSFTGLTPGKRSSGPSNPEVSITKEGNGYLRLALVNAASVYRDYRNMYSAEELDALPCPVRKEFLKRLQDRLCSRYRHLKNNGKSGNEPKCAVARELAGFIWELVNKVAPKLVEYRLAA